MEKLSNDFLSIAVKEHGAELASIRYGNREYLWQADAEFWKRHSPVLFPIVGSVWNGEYRSDNKTYMMGQHGFARDMDFKLVSKSENEIYFALESSEETLAKYPYPFKLTIGYRINDNEIEVIWKVDNPSDKEIFFSIGAHPAFYWPMFSDETIAKGVEAMKEELAESENRGYFLLDAKDSYLTCSVITEGGCVDPNLNKLVNLSDGYLPLDTNTFNHDALVIENNQISCVTLCDAEKNPYLTVKYDAPLIGLWSPPHKNAPFVCIEPWYGRCDRVHYQGEYENKDWIQKLSPKESFEVSYKIIIEKQ